jgi:2-haloacid dehalogenase
MKKLDGISTLVFDAYGTLFDFSAGVRRCKSEIGEKSDALVQLWRTKQLEYTWLRSLMNRYEDFWHVTGQALDQAMATLGMENAPLRAKLMQLYLSLEAYADAAATLSRLKEASRGTAILSNGSPTMLMAAVKNAGLTKLLDAVLSVDGLKIYKPHPSVYELVTARFSCAPKEVGFVSANYWDAAAAADFGFQAIWINRSNAPPDPLPGKPSAVVRSLSDVPEILGAVPA